MKHPPFAVLKLSLLLLVLALVLSTGGVLWSGGQAQDAAAAVRQQQRAVQASQQQLQRSRQQQQLVATHLAAYQALSARGFVGAEDRLAWIEAAQQANRDAGLYGLDYRLAPRTAAPPALAQGLPLGQSVMTLTLPLLVETDLARFLTALRARAPGLYRVQGCRLSQPAPAPFAAVNQPHLQAECDLQWFTVASSAGSRR